MQFYVVGIPATGLLRVGGVRRDHPASGQRRTLLNLRRLLRAGARRICCIRAGGANHGTAPGKVVGDRRACAGRIDQPFTYNIGNDSAQRHDHTADLLRGVSVRTKERQHADDKGRQCQPKFAGCQFLCPIDFHMSFFPPGIPAIIFLQVREASF